MERLIYTSVARPDIGPEEIDSIVQSSALANPLRSVTGFLIFDHGCFFQYLEGPTNELDALLVKIKRDRRHSGVKVRARSAARSPLFARWRMQRVRIGGEVEKDLLARFTAEHETLEFARLLRRFPKEKPD